MIFTLTEIDKKCCSTPNFRSNEVNYLLNVWPVSSPSLSIVYLFTAILFKTSITRRVLYKDNFAVEKSKYCLEVWREKQCVFTIVPFSIRPSQKYRKKVYWEKKLVHEDVSTVSYKRVLSNVCSAKQKTISFNLYIYFRII